MDFLSLIYSLVLGAGAGILYGISFLSHKNKVLKSVESFSPRARSFFIFALYSLVRLGLLAFFWLYVLRTPSLHIILVLASFLGGFWIVIMQKKVCPDAKR